MSKIASDRPRFRRLLLSVLVLATTGCGEPTASRAPPDSGISLAARVLAGEVAVYTDLCACPAALGFADSATCFVYFVARSPSQADCVRGVFESDAAEVDSILECELDVIATARECLANVIACDTTGVLQCATAGQAANTACGAYPSVVQQGIDECYGVIRDAGSQ